MEGNEVSKVYVIAQITIKDPEGYEAYGSKFMEVLSGFDGQLLGVADGPEVIEGAFGGTRAVIVEFSSREELERWYRSDAYQEILTHRLASSDGTIFVVPSLPQG